MKQTDFQSTIWTTINKARSGDTKAFEELVTKYREPIKRFIARSEFTDHDSEDLSQEVFLTIFAKKVLDKADKAKGRFRNLLLAVTKNVIKTKLRELSTQKRGRDTDVIALETIPDEELDLIIHSDERDEQFDQLWAINLVRIAMQKLRAESEQHYQVIERILKGEDTFAAIAGELGKTVQDIKNYAHRARERMTRFIEAEIASYCSSQQEYQEELKSILQYINYGR